MKIDRIEVYHVCMPLIYPWRTAYGEDANIHSVLVKMVSGNEYGWGETSPLNAPCYSPEWAGGVFSLIKEFLAPQIIGKDIESAEQLLSHLQHFKGNPFAKAGLEVAWWVLNAKMVGKPLHQLLGGRTCPVDVGADFGVQDSIEMLLEKIEKAIDDGFPRVKLKFKRGWDIDMLKAVRDRFPSHTFHIDCNSGFSLADLDLFKKVDRFDLAMIEQPLFYADLIDHAKLQKEIATPICLDESVTSPKMAEQAIELESCRYMNIKMGRVGGLSNAVKIHDMCEAAGIPCWVGGMLESAVGAGISIELASLRNIKYPSDLFPSRNFYLEDLGYPEIVLCGQGKIDVSKVPGTPYEPRKDKLEEETVEKAVMSL
ncbi:MAG: o-succinylbenzoate synthase [Nitrososphaeria archaeon]